MISKPTECKRTEAVLSEFIDGHLATDRAWRVQLHLSACPRCAAEARTLRGTIDLLRGTPPPPLSVGFDARLAGRLTTLAHRPRRIASAVERVLLRLPALPGLWRLNRPLAAAAASVAAALIVFGVFAGLDPSALFGRAHVPSPRSAAVVAPSTSSDDLAFIAACANQQAQYGSLRPIADPTAQIVAERVDESGASASQTAGAQQSADANDD